MPADPNRRAQATVDIVDAILNGEPPAKDPEPVARGKLDGAKGGKFRADKLRLERRKEIASLAARARWQRPKPDQT